MAVDGTPGPKNQPRFLAEGAPEDWIDMAAVGDYAAKVGNMRADTHANRLSATGGDLWEGLHWQETDGDKFEWAYQASSWVPVGGAPITGTLGHVAGVGANAAVEFLEKDHTGKVRLYWSGTASAPVLNGTTMGSVPAGFRPAANYEAPATGNGGTPGPCSMVIATSGSITVFGITGSGNSKVSFFAEYFAA